VRKYRYEWTTECVGGNGSRVTVVAWRVTSATCWFPYSGVVISSRSRISRSRVWQSPNADLLPGGRVQDKPTVRRADISSRYSVRMSRNISISVRNSRSRERCSIAKHPSKGFQTGHLSAQCVPFPSAPEVFGRWKLIVERDRNEMRVCENSLLIFGSTG